MIKQRLDRLLSVIYVMTEDSYLEKVHVVFVSMDGEYEFVYVVDNEEFEDTLALLIENDFLALGLIQLVEDWTDIHSGEKAHFPVA